MARPSGSRDAQFEARRTTLIALARVHLSAPGGRNASWRELASACGVSPSTLAHYFGDRESLVRAILENAREEGDVYLQMAGLPAGRFAESIRQLVALLGQGLDRGVLALQVIGLTEGLASTSSAEAYLGHHLEPVLQAIGKRLAAHQASGEMRQTNPNFAAIGLLSPMVIVRLHQSELGGATHYPMNLSAFDEQHAEAFVRSYGSSDPASAGERPQG